jgi:hypothetical protein
MLFYRLHEIIDKDKFTGVNFDPRGTPFPNPETGIGLQDYTQLYSIIHESEYKRASETLQDKGFGIQERLRRRGSSSFTVSAIGGKKLSIE